MTVHDLIEQLKKLPMEHRVVVSGYEDGVEDVNSVVEVEIKLNVFEAWYYGSHDIVDEGKEYDEKAIFIGWGS